MHAVLKLIVAIILAVVMAVVVMFHGHDHSCGTCCQLSFTVFGRQLHVL